MTEITDHRFPGDSLNDSITLDVDERDPANGNASHIYEMWMPNECGESEMRAQIAFQKGPRNEEGSVPGVTDAAVLAVILDRYRGFQAGKFACPDNAIVITKLEEALMRMQKRTKDRMVRGVLGKNES